MKRESLLVFAFLALAIRLPAGEAVSQYNPDPAAMTEEEWVEYRYQRFAVERANPDLLAMQKQIGDETKAQAEKLSAAMIKADPKVGPILARRDALLNGNWYEAPATVAPLSAADWQQLRAARAAALQADPALAASAAQLKQKQQAFDAQVDAALVKADPSLAAFLAKLKKQGGANAAGN